MLKYRSSFAVSREDVILGKLYVGEDILTINTIDESGGFRFMGDCIDESKTNGLETSCRC